MKAKLNIINSYFSIPQNKDIPLDTHHYSITINDFHDKKEADVILLKVQEMIRTFDSKVRVYGQ